MNDSKSVTLSFGSSLWYCHKLPDLFWTINCFSGITTSRSFALSTWIIYFGFAVSEWWEIFEYYLLVSRVWISWCYICSCFFDFHGFFHKYIHITVVTKTWPQHGSLEPNLLISSVSYNDIIIHFNTVFCS